MKNIGTMFFLMIFLCISLFPVSAETGHFTLLESYWGLDQRIEVSPGDTAVLTIVLRVEQLGTIKNIEANLTLPTGLLGLSGTNTANVYYSSSVTQGQQLKLQFSIYIIPDVKIGTYSAELVMRYYYQNLLTWQDPIRIEFQISGRPDVRLQPSDFELVEGKQSGSLELKNVGEATAKNLKINEISSSGLIIENYSYGGSIDPGKIRSIDLDLMVPPGTKGKALTIVVKGSYYGPLNIVYQFSQSVQLIVKQIETKPNISLNLSSSELSIGKSDNLTISVVNEGSDDVSGVSISIGTDAILKLFTSSKAHIEMIDSGEEKTLPLKIYVPPTTQAATSTLTVSVTYFNEGTRIADTFEQKFNLLLRGFIDISLTDVTVIPATPRMGSSFSITMTITNIGTSAASAAYATPSLENLPLTSFGSKSTYIGNIEINSPVTFTISLQASNSTKTDIVLPVTLKYMDNLRTIHEEKFTVPFQLLPPQRIETTQSTNQNGGNRGLLLYGAIAVIGIAIVGIILWRRR